MKKILVLPAFFTAVLFFTVISCKSGNKGAFSISGKIIDSSKDNVHKKIYLKEIDLTGKEPVVIDSQLIAQDGSYKLKSNLAGQHLFIIMIDQGFPFLIINDNDKITYDIYPSNPLHPAITGSDATSQLYSFINEYRPKDSALIVTYAYADSLNKLPNHTTAQDSLSEVLDKKKKSIIADINASIKNFVATANNPVSVFYVLNVMASRTIEPKDLQPLAQAASDRFKSDGMLAAFASRVKEANASEAQYNSKFDLLNQPAPDLAMQTPEGKTMKISDFKGKYLLVDFWASWCGPCRAENPNVVKAYNKYKNKNFTILGISLDNDKAAWIKAIHDDNLSWNHMSDLKQWQSAAVSTYKFDGIPFNVLIDPTGKIIADNLRGDDLENKLSELFDNAPPAKLDNAPAKPDSTKAEAKKS